MKRLLPVVLLAACSVGESGIEPPLDRIFLPSVARVDGSSRWLYVVSSNLDLRFRAGTVAALDLQAAAADRAIGNWPMCPATRQVLQGQPARFCCRDALDPRVLNCDDRGYVQAGETVMIGSFGAAMVIQPFERQGVLRERLFVAVRGDPSITFIDAVTSAQAIDLDCDGPIGDGATGERECDELHRIGEGVAQSTVDVLTPPGPFSFAEEPFALSLDPTLGLLYVGHLPSTSNRAVAAVSGISVFDVCGAETLRVPTLTSFTRFAFGGGGEALGVTTVVPAEPGNPQAPVYATARFSSDIGEMVLDGATSGCPTAPRDVRLVPRRSVFTTTFAPRGSDLRGLLLDPARQRAFALHNNSDSGTQGLSSPAALALLDTRPDAFGDPSFEPRKTVELGASPVEMALHDAGRGPRLYVVAFDAGQIWVVDPDLFEVVSIIDVGRGPSSIDFADADPGTAYVANFADNNVAVVDLRPGSPSENQVVQRIGFPRDASENADLK